jgi:hypothetical protein
MFSHIAVIVVVVGAAAAINVELIFLSVYLVVLSKCSVVC